MFIGHLPAGYLATMLLLHRADAPAAARRRLLTVGLIASVLPDLDLLWFFTVGQRRQVHHAYLPHLPLACAAFFAAAALLLWIARARRESWLGWRTAIGEPPHDPVIANRHRRPRDRHSERSPMRGSRVGDDACRAPEESSRGRSEARPPPHPRGHDELAPRSVRPPLFRDMAGVVARQPAMPRGRLLQRKRTLRGAGSRLAGRAARSGLVGWAEWIPREPTKRWRGRGFGAVGSARNDSLIQWSKKTRAFPRWPNLDELRSRVAPFSTLRKDLRNRCGVQNAPLNSHGTNDCH